MQTVSGGGNRLIINLLMPFFSMGVNLFVLITGYFLVTQHTFKILKAEKIWLQTVFYTLLGSVGLLFIKGGTFSQYVSALTYPLFYSTGYWFVNKYLGLLLVAPFLSLLASKMTKRQYQLLLLAGLLLCVTMQVPLGTMFSEAGGGMSLQWFVFLFFVGGYIRIYGLASSTGAVCRWFWIFYACSFLILQTSCMLYDKRVPMWLSNNSVIFFESVCFFLLVKNGTFRSKCWKPFVAMAPYTFGIYLVHHNPLVMHYLWDINLNPFLRLANSPLMLPVWFLECLLVFFLSALVDYVRKLCLEKVDGDKLLSDLNQYVLRIVRGIKGYVSKTCTI